MHFRVRPIMGEPDCWKIAFHSGFEQNSIRPEEKGRLIEEIEKAMRDSCLEL